MDHVTHFKLIWVKLCDMEIDFSLLFFFQNGSYTEYYLGCVAESMTSYDFSLKKKRTGGSSNNKGQLWFMSFESHIWNWTNGIWCLSGLDMIHLYLWWENISLWKWIPDKIELMQET